MYWPTLHVEEGDILMATFEDGAPELTVRNLPVEAGTENIAIVFDGRPSDYAHEDTFLAEVNGEADVRVHIDHISDIVGLANQVGFVRLPDANLAALEGFFDD